MRITWIKLHAKIWSLKQPLKNISHWMPWWKHTVYYARYESELARKRYMNADPENRLVCSELKWLWNEKMNVLFKSEMEQKRHEKENMVWTPPFSMDELYQFPEKLKEAWCGRHLDMTTKKRILRCLIQDVTLNDKMGMIQVGIRFHTGAEELIEVGRPLKKYETWTTSPELVDYIRAESRRHTVEEITAMLNDMRKKSGKGKPFTQSIVRRIQYRCKIPSLKQHLKSIGYLTTEEKAKELGRTCCRSVGWSHPVIKQFSIPFCPVFILIF